MSHDDPKLDRAGRPEDGAESRAPADAADLAAIALHDLAGPLGVASVLAQRVRAKLPDGTTCPTVTTAIDDLVTSIGCAMEILRSFRAGLKVRRTERAPVDVNRLVRRVVDGERAAARLAGASLELLCHDDVLSVTGCARQLECAIGNVVRNAIEAVGRRGTVSVAARRTSECEIEVSVADDGPGIDDGIDPFSAFITSKESGSGLGLTIALHFITAHGGSIELLARRPTGTVVSLRLPAAPAADAG